MVAAKRPIAFALASAACAAAIATTSSAAAEARKFALAMFHFNIQYVAGGVVGFGGPNDERSPEQIEDLIVTESLEPVLDLYLAHPTWGQDIEMQGYMLDVIAARHPRVLDKLKKLVASGQIDVDSFHYSDQLFIAYPPVDWERSQKLNDAAFDRSALTRGPSVFCQEGQAGIGFAASMKSHGYATLVWPPNLWKKQHEGNTPAPLYRFGDVRLIVGENTTTTIGSDTIESNWTFLDDGELLATDGANPYLVSSFRRSEKAIREYEEKLAKLEREGFAVTTVAKYVKALEDKGVAAAEPPPLIDGTWQPQVTESTHKWTGGRGLWLKDERDNDVRTLAAIAHRELLVAETLARKASLQVEPEIDSAWRLLALGQVSDATGINPIRGEIEYGLSHLTETLRIARAITERAKASLGANAVDVDTDSGEVKTSAYVPAGGRSVETGPLAPEVTAAGRSVRLAWEELEPDHFVLTVTIAVGDDRSASIRFPGTAGDLLYTPALTTTPVRVKRDAFNFDRFTLPLHDGLIGLGGDLHVVKDMAFVHLGARITTTSGDVTFIDDTLPAGEEAVWKFHLLRGGDDKAAALAKRINVTPRVSR